MRAAARVRAAGDGDRVRFVELRSDPPLIVRPTPSALYLVGGSAGPLGGDALDLGISVERGASLDVTSAAATLALPGPAGGASTTTVRLRVDDGSSLHWRPQPLVSVQGSDHVVDVAVELHGSATLRLVDEVMLGRSHERSGRLRLRTRVRRDGRTLLAHDLDVGPGAAGWDSVAVIGDARALIGAVVIGPRAAVAARVVEMDDGSRAGWLPFAPHAALLQALGPTLGGARRAAAALARDEGA